MNKILWLSLILLFNVPGMVHAEVNLQGLLKYFTQNPPKIIQTLNTQILGCHQPFDCQMDKCHDAYRIIRIYALTNNLPRQAVPTPGGGLNYCYGFLRSEGTGFADKIRECAFSPLAHQNAPGNFPDFVGDEQCKHPYGDTAYDAQRFLLWETKEQVSRLTATNIETGEEVPLFNPESYYVICFKPEEIKNWEDACGQNCCHVTD